MKRLKKLTISSLMSAMSVVILYLASFFEALDLSLSMLASLIVLIILIELGPKWAFSLYLTVSVISLLILPQKYLAFMYLFFCGLYPMLRIYFNRLPKILAAIVKILYFGLTLSLVLLASYFIFKLEIYTGAMLVLFYGVSYLAFLLSDILLGKLTKIYHFKLRRMLGIDKLFK